LSFDEQIRAALDSTAASLRQHFEAEMLAFSREAARLAGEDRQQAAKAAEAAAAEVRAQAESQIAQLRAAAQKHAEEVKRAAETQIAELRKTLEELRSQAQKQLDTTRRMAQAEIEKAQAEVEKVHAEIAGTQAEVATAQAEIEKARRESAEARSETEKASAETQKARAETEKARAETERARAEADAARAESETVRQNARREIAQAEATHSASERHIADAIERANADNRQAEVSRAARLVSAIRTLDEARGLSEVLERLVERAGDEVDRAAVLLVKGDRLTGWRLTGFAPEAASATSIDLSVDDAGLAGDVLRTDAAVSSSSDSEDGARLPSFAGNSDGLHAIALPVRVGGEIVAVLYADAPRVEDPTGDGRWPAVLEVLARHASRVLEAMTVQKAAGLAPRPMAHGSHVAVPGQVDRTSPGIAQ